MNTRPRKHRKRYNELGHAHELTFSCYRGFKFLQADRTCRWLAESIEEARVAHAFDVWAYVFMPEHAHVIVHPNDPDCDVSTILKAIKAPVGTKAITYIRLNAPKWLPKITRQRGKKTERLFWQSGGGYDRNVVEPQTLMNMIDYVHLNPVRRGLVSKADAWSWSSAAWYAYGGNVPLLPDKIPAEWLEEIT